ncbi:MAG: hypothetical protein U9R25_02140 [Chloroflexota bacterium]|nr:hypothetical protein [Chloroflexota bacterium]
MKSLKTWWSNDLPKSVKFVFAVLLANAVPAFFILMVLPDWTETLFVWTVKPVINARLVGVMYGNALLLVAIGIFQPNWPRVRIIMVVITLFSILATLLTFVYLKPFLAHPWYHLTYWLGMYLILFFAAPYVFITQERAHGGRLPVRIPLNLGAKVLAALAMIAALVCGLGLLFRIDTVNQYWPWTMPPLVGGLIGVLFTTHAVAYAWALWDGDWIRVRPMFWQAPPTALLFLLLPMLHPGDLRPNAGSTLTLYYVIAGFVLLAFSMVILSHRSPVENLAEHAE